jgi:hypothetical protein
VARRTGPALTGAFDLCATSPPVFVARGRL